MAADLIVRTPSTTSRSRLSDDDYPPNRFLIDGVVIDPIDNLRTVESWCWECGKLSPIESINAQLQRC